MPQAASTIVCLHNGPLTPDCRIYAQLLGRGGPQGVFRNSPVAWHRFCFVGWHPRIITDWTGYEDGSAGELKCHGSLKAERIRGNVRLIFLTAGDDNDQISRPGVLKMPNKPSDDEIVLLARQAGLNLPAEYLPELIEAYCNVRAMIDRIPTGRPRGDEPAHVFVPKNFLGV